MFNEEIQTNYIYDAHKPSIKNYQKAMEIMGTDLKSTIFVGDQLFTDVWGAKRTGIRNILVKPIHPKEEIQIVLKRRLEWIVLWFYKRQNKK
jgi:HAD superfamily phosphatase (TIGR01668 family)